MPKQNKDSLFRNLSRLFKSGPLIRRRVKLAGTDTSRAPTASSAMDIFKQSQSRLYNRAINSFGSYDRMCSDICTLIPVPGPERFKSIKQLIDEYPNGKKFIVYAYDHEQRKIVPAWAHHPRVSGEKETVEITFDDGSTFVCTPDHPCMLRDGTYRDAGELKPGDSMMPFYRKVFSGKKREGNGIFDDYANIFTMAKNGEGWRGWEPEHRLIVEWMTGKRVKKLDEHVHHIDRNLANNNPENLVVMDAKEHLAKHGQESAALWNDPAYREKTTASLRKAWENPERKAALAEQNRRPDVREKRRQHWLKNNVAKDPETAGKISAAAIERYSNQAERTRQSESIKRAHAEGRLHTDEAFSKYWVGKTRSQEWKDARKKEGNPNYAAGLTYELFVGLFERHGRDRDAALVDAKISATTLQRRMKQLGYKGWSGFCDKHELNNHKVLSVKLAGVRVVGDLTVDGYENFATNTILCHNSRYADFSEMEYSPEISSALDIFSDESCASDENGRTLHIYSDDKRIRKVLEELFYDTMNVEFNLRPWVRNLCKYGDVFLFIDTSPEFGVMNIFPIPVNECEREEGYDPDDPLAVRFRWVTQGNKVLENWQIAHMRLSGNDAFAPYGSSVLESARRVWRQLILIEDAMLVYRVVRSPERRVFYIDVAGVPPEETQNYMEKAKAALRTNQVIDKDTGKLDLRNNSMDVLQDYFIPVRGGESGTKIDTLPGGAHVSAVEDVAYIQSKLFAALKVPKAYLNYDDSLCLTGDTRVPLLDGTTVTIADIATRFSAGQEKPELWCYSTDAKGNMVPGRIVDAWQTKTVDELYRVTLDSGHVIECTSNHPFLCRDGTYKRADELQPDQSLRAIYRKLSSKAKGDLIDDYEMLWQDGEWKYTHKLVNESVAAGDHKVKKMRVIHHANFDKRDNTPSNLQEMTWHEHRKFHAHHLETTLLRPDVIEKKERLRIQGLKSDHHRAIKHDQMLRETTTPGCGLYEWIHGDEISGKMSSVMKENWTKPEYKENRARLQNARIAEALAKAKKPEDKHNAEQWIKGVYTLETFTGFCRTHDVSNKKQFLMNKDAQVSVYIIDRMLRSWGYESWDRFSKENLNWNHKVVSVELVKLISPRPVYDLEIDCHHNFAVLAESVENVGDSTVSSMVLVHNSSKATLSQQDIRFSRTVNMIQRVVIAELNKIAAVHLYANGFDGEELLDFALRLSNPSTIAQQQKLELYRTKFEIAGQLPENLTDRYYLRKHVLGLTDDEIKRIEAGLVRDKKFDSAIEAQTGEAGGGMPDLGEPSGAGDEGMGDMDLTAGHEREGVPLLQADEREEEDLLLGTPRDADDGDTIDGLKDDERDTQAGSRRGSGGGVPVKADPRAATAHNRKRRSHHGASQTHMPDLAKMVGMQGPQDTDVYDRRTLGIDTNPLRNVFGTSRVHAEATGDGHDAIRSPRDVDRLRLSGVISKLAPQLEKLRKPSVAMLAETSSDDVSDDASSQHELSESAVTDIPRDPDVEVSVTEDDDDSEQR